MNYVKKTTNHHLAKKQNSLIVFIVIYFYVLKFNLCMFLFLLGNKITSK